MNNNAPESERLTCGLVMPISPIGECSVKHWQDVRAILTEAIEEAGEYQVDLVSNKDEAHVIQKTIIQNLFTSDIVVCDVSGGNPNVMFELGIRLTFDKPTVIVKDRETKFNFDTAPVVHLEYPRDLRYTDIQDFKGELTKRVKATYEAGKVPGYSPFLREFTVEIPRLETESVPGSEYFAKRFDDLEKLIRQRTERPTRRIGNRQYHISDSDRHVIRGVFENTVDYCLREEGSGGEGIPSRAEVIPLAFSKIPDSVRCILPNELIIAVLEEEWRKEFGDDCSVTTTTPEPYR